MMARRPMERALMGINIIQIGGRTSTTAAAADSSGGGLEVLQLSIIFYKGVGRVGGLQLSRRIRHDD